jgi:hypothetical protein
VLYGTNALWIEHRFQGASVPEPADWDWASLTIANGATDMHRIIESFQQHYDGNWVSTGASKGGITATYHKFLFPDDLDGSIPYVAPASRAPVDPFYQDYLDRALPSPCAQDLRDAQVAALTTRREMMRQRLEAAIGADVPIFLDYVVAYADWGFWQYYGVGYCGQVPTAAATDDQFWQFFAEQSGLGPQGGPGAWAQLPPAERDDERSDGALSYEWLTEQGFALQYGAHIAALLSDEFKQGTMRQNFLDSFPEVPLPPHSSDVTARVRRWARERAENLLLIYGEYDPWSGGAMAEPEHPSSARFFVPEATHGAAITGLLGIEQEAALAHATRMFGVAPGSLRREARRANANRQAILERLERRQHTVGTVGLRLQLPR